MTGIRPFRAGDEPALAEICVLTGAAGQDATGHYSRADLLPDIFVLPYVAKHPDAAFVAESDDGRVVGYIVCAPDTDAFEGWFREQWWPPLRGAFADPGAPARDPRDAEMVRYADARRPGANALAATFPAHLHIDLLPEAQGQGMGRRFIDTLLGELRSRGVRGLHLVADAGNTGALAFYDRLGLDRLPSSSGTQAFGVSLD